MTICTASLWSVVPVVASQSSTAPKAEQTPAAPKSTPPTSTAEVNGDAAVLADFKARLDKYVELHKQVAKTSPKIKESNNPSQIDVAETALAEHIRKARATAQPGDIFTPEVRAQFRRLLSPQLKGEDGQDAKKVLKDDAPAAVPMKVNAAYPSGASLPTVPAKLLLSLPTLPKEVEYRIINKHLILRDTQANIIVDFIPNAIP